MKTTQHTRCHKDIHTHYTLTHNARHTRSVNNQQSSRDQLKQSPHPTVSMETRTKEIQLNELAITYQDIKYVLLLLAVWFVTVSCRSECE